MAKNKSVQEARQTWVLAEIEKLKLANPVAELSTNLGYGMSLISEVLNKKASVSLKFFQRFCEYYGFDAKEIDLKLIDKIKYELTSNNSAKDSKSGSYKLSGDDGHKENDADAIDSEELNQNLMMTRALKLLEQQNENFGIMARATLEANETSRINATSTERVIAMMEKMFNLEGRMEVKNAER